MTGLRAHLWFDRDGHDAARFYAEHIPGTTITREVSAPDGTPGVPAGAPFIVELTMMGLPLTFLSAGPSQRLSEAFSFSLECEDQDEVDRYWDLLTSDGGRPGPCGWCTDRFGVSWQVTPAGLDALIAGTDDPEASGRAMRAMLTMHKLDLAALRAAYDGESVSA
ncbi:VOC family protein [Cellulomonas endophytica]|uniref:VOC family protein n=1 Tax=Cellulomonas endophytica TaxID=2494735 RepID=UPI001012CD19|nr:VOC family protein [Cellulomonas endophytica]